MISLIALSLLLNTTNNNLHRLKINNEKSKVILNYPLVPNVFKKSYEIQINKSNKFPVDCIFSIGRSCRPAHYLRTYNLRFQAAPFDWMMKYSLDEVINQLENKFAHFFEDIEDITKENSKGDSKFEHRFVKDKIGNTVSMHHFPKDISAEDYLPTFRETMIRRGERVDQIIKDSSRIGFLYWNDFDNFSKIVEFGKKFNKLYPNKQVVIFNIVNLKEKIPTCLYSVNNISKNLTVVTIQFHDVPINKNGEEYNSWKGNESKWDKYVLPRIVASDKLKQRLSESNVKN